MPACYGCLMVDTKRTQMERPIENCYWVLPGKLLAGEYPRNKDESSSGQKLAALSNAGVNVFVDLTEAGELAPCADMSAATHHRFPIRDVSVPSSVEQMMIEDLRIDSCVP